MIGCLVLGIALLSVLYFRKCTNTSGAILLPELRYRRLSQGAERDIDSDSSFLSTLLRDAGEPEQMLGSARDFLEKETDHLPFAICVCRSNGSLRATCFSQQVPRRLASIITDLCTSFISDLPSPAAMSRQHLRVFGIEHATLTPIEFDGRLRGLLWIGERGEGARTVTPKHFVKSLEIAFTVAQLLDDERETITEERALLSGLSHDLCAPTQCALATIRQTATDKDSICDTLQRVDYLLHDQLISIRNFLDFLNSESLQNATTKSTLLANEEIRDILSSFAHILEASSTASNVTVSARYLCPGKILFDRPTFRRIVWNLLSNALKFTQHGEILVTTSYDGSLLRLTVEDTGIGVPEELRPRLFREALLSGLSASKRGSGLGLFICQRLAQLNDASVFYEARPDGGSIFGLKAVRAGSDGENEPDLPTSGRALIVDDEPFHCRMVKRSLVSAGLTCDCATCLDAAISLIDAKEYDYLIVDYWLGADSSIALLEAANIRSPNCHVVIVTGEESPRTRELTRRFNGASILIKPLTRESLLQALRRKKLGLDQNMGEQDDLQKNKAQKTNTKNSHTSTSIAHN